MSISKIISEVGEEGLKERIAEEILNTEQNMECANSVEENREMYGRLKLLEELYGREELSGALKGYTPPKDLYEVKTTKRFEENLERIKSKNRNNET